MWVDEIYDALGSNDVWVFSIVSISIFLCGLLLIGGLKKFAFRQGVSIIRPNGSAVSAIVSGFFIFSVLIAADAGKNLKDAGLTVVTEGAVLREISDACLDDDTIKSNLSSYVQDVVVDERVAMMHGQRSSRVDADLAQLNRSMKSSKVCQAPNLFNKLKDTREIRLFYSKSAIPWQLWVSLLINLLVVLLFLIALHIDDMASTLFVLLACTLAFGTLISVNLMLDRPFGRGIAVDLWFIESAAPDRQPAH